MAVPDLRGAAVQYLISCKTTVKIKQKASEFSWKKCGETGAFLLIFRRVREEYRRKKLSYKAKKEINDS